MTFRILDFDGRGGSGRPGLLGGRGKNYGNKTDNIQWRFKRYTLMKNNYFMSYILDKFKAATLAVLTGFVIGSLGVIWPWKFTLEKTIGTKTVVTGYQWQLPALEKPLLLAVLLMLAGAGLVLLLDRIAGKKESKK